VAYRFMTDALGRPLSEVADAPEMALAQVERAISETLEHHAHLRLMPAVGRLG
jgi:DNA repair protein RecO (recombination protein O)